MCVKNNFRKFSNYGFTMIELMVVVAIVAILASLAAPSFSELLRTNRLTAASSALQVSLSLARSEAVRRGADARVSVVANTAAGQWTGGWTVYWHSANAPTEPAPTADSTTIQRIEVVAAPAAPLSASYTGALTAFTYAGNGRLIDPTGSATVNKSLWFFDGNSSKFCIIISRSGRVRTDRVGSSASCSSD
jgi:type IV fimbrial biogenesis protein FimT